MMEFRYGFLLATTFLIGQIYAQTDELQYDMLRAKRYCGSNLAQALSTICRGNYNTIHKKQESHTKQLYQKKSYWEEQYAADLQNDNLAYPLQKRSIATSLMGNSRRRKRMTRGVYNECCEKSCSREELSSYCASPTKRRR
ncbi:hypothetical protein NQ318_020504 [Aromia moschata]|uniref:Insulin-like domain-containing protein n=1 Tax=Aromia moschata TaxID=1265417 RepID=A0AAV8YDG4_9CUCU|nr:hypothetical protein NQ318_020504 [Aromia moschata]